MKHVKLAIIILLVLVSLTLTGCSDHYASSKQQMIKDWNSATTKAQMPVISNLIEQGQYDQALGRLDSVLKKEPANPYALYLLGLVQANKEQVVAARATLVKALDINPELHEAWYVLATLSQYEKNYNDALTYYDKACEIMPVNSHYAIGKAMTVSALGQTDKARDTLDSMLSSQPDNVELMTALADLENRCGNTKRAIELYNKAMLSDGQDVPVLESLAYCYVSTKQWALAAGMVEKLSSDCKIPEQKQAYAKALAMCTFNAGQYDKALKYYDKLSVEFRDDADVWVKMANCSLASGDTTRSIYCANKALAIEPGNSEATSILGCALYAKGDYDKSLDTFSVLLGNQKYASLAWFMTGRSYQRLGDDAMANDAFAKAKELNPNGLLMQFAKD